MTDLELLKLAASVLPDELKTLPGAIVRRVEPGQPPRAFAAAAAPHDDEMLLSEMELMLDTKLPRQPVQGADSVDVAFHEDTPVGRRTTVVQIRSGQFHRRIGQA
jgi:hypothetical protein